MKFFIDNNLAPKHAKALQALFEGEHQIIHLREMFPHNAKDEEWLPRLSEEGGWIIISGDLGIGRNPHQRAMWEQGNVVIFFLARGWAELELVVKHSKLTTAFPKIIEAAKKAKGGSGFQVRVNGSVEKVF